MTLGLDRRWAELAKVLASAAALAGCAGYQARPLPSQPDLKAGIGALRINPARLRLSPLKSITIDPAKGLDPLQIAVLAVLTSPDLEAKRAALGVNAAQVFAAGLLPDLQFNLGVDRPVAGPDHENAYSVSPSLDLAGLIARGHARAAARSNARQADLDLLWAEWGAAQQARGLAETVLADEAKAAYLRQVLALAADRSARSAAALERRDITLQAAAADLAAKLDAQTLTANAEHDARKARRDLNAMLGLDAAVILPLVRGPDQGRYDEAALIQAQQALDQRRPDLLALRAGYEAQDASLRKAVLAQFPINQLAAAFAKDTAGSVTQGVSIAAALPIFNGGRGEVRVQEATREQLRAEYQARLDQTDAEVKAAEAELASASAQVEALGSQVPRLEALMQPADRAFARGDLDGQSYLTLQQNALSRRADLDDRELSMRLAEIEIETALFLPPANARARPDEP
jgi:outer membrane protein TolC